MLSLVAWKLQQVKIKPYHYYCTVCKQSAKVVSAIGNDLHNVSWLKKRIHPCKMDSWDAPNHAFHALRVLYPEILYSVWNDIKTKACPSCDVVGQLIPTYNSPFDINLVKKSFENWKPEDISKNIALSQLPLNPEITGVCQKCHKDIDISNGGKMLTIQGKLYCISCFVTIE